MRAMRDEGVRDVGAGAGRRELGKEGARSALCVGTMREAGVRYAE